jgi:hypothetical protein
MPRNWILAGLVGLLLIAAAIAMSLLAISGSQLHGQSHRISVSLLGYTNDVSGIPCGRFIKTNVATQRFTVFRVENPTRCDLFCYFGAVILKPSDGSHADPAQFQSPQLGDFDLRPRGSSIVAVPEPAISGRWQLIFSLCHRHNYRHGWEFRLARLTSWLGLDWHDKKSWIGFSPEISK